VATYLTNELGFGRLLDFGLIEPRLPQLYALSPSATYPVRVRIPDSSPG